MTTEQHKQFIEGRQLWQAYIDVNGYSFAPNDKGLRALAAQNGLKTAHVRKCIHTFLSA